MNVRQVFGLNLCDFLANWTINEKTVITIVVHSKFEGVEIRISLRFDKKYFARYHFRFIIFSLFYLVPIRNA